MATNKVTLFLKTYKKTFFILILALWGFLLSGENTFATDPDPVIDEETSDKIIQVINFILAGAASVLWIVTSFVTIFIYPGWTNGTMFWLLEYLKEIWILVSNVVYFIFAFILIAIAFMNIIGKWEWTWELKQAMPKFIVWVLIVPFSWFFVQFVLSITAILTVGVLTLPYDSFRDKTLFDQALSNPEIADMQVCKHVMISLTGEPPEGASAYTDAEGNTLSEKLFCENWEMVTVQEILDPTSATWLESSIFGITSVYTYGILKVHEMDEINGDNLWDYKDLADLIFKVFFDVLFVIVYLLLMIALFLALFVRWVRLWIYIMLSPAFWLLYFFGKWSEGFWESGKHFNIKEFIALAMVPVYASAALAFGLAFILVAAEWIKEAAGEWDEMETLTAGWFSLSIYWAHGWTGTNEKSPLAKMIVEIFGIVILWIAVMAALRSSEATKAIIEPIHKFGTDVWQLAAKAPTYAPIIPTGNGMISAQSLPMISNSIRASMDESARERGTSFMENAWIWQSWGASDPWLRRDIWTLATRIENDSNLNRADVERFSALAGRFDGNTNVARRDPEMRRLLEALGTALGVEITDAHFTSDTQFRRLLSELHNEARRQDRWDLLGIGREASDTSFSQTDLSRLFWAWAEAPDPDATATPRPADPVTQTRNVNITVNWVETTAWSALDWLWTIDDRTALDARLASDGITWPAAAAIVAAFEAARAEEDE